MIKLSVELPIEKKQDECGVIAVRSPGGSVARDLVVGLMALQHRGQESAGIATHDGKNMHSHKGMGLANEVFSEAILDSLKGGIGVGHVRYSTTGHSMLENAQPLRIETQAGKFAIGLNGNLVNYHALRAELEAKGYAFKTTTDTECLGYLLAEELLSGKDEFDSCANIMPRLDGAYCFTVLMENGDVLVMRDPNGFRPLCLGERGETLVIASETVALDALDAKFVRYIQPGEVVLLDGGVRSKIVCKSDRISHCMFEWVYISRPDSIIEGQYVIEVRERLGEKLAQLYPDLKNKVDIVVPVPDSGRSAAYAYSRATGVRLAEALQKNRYIHRTFIMPGDERRRTMVKLKLNIVKHLVEGKRVVLVDDSVVRGTTMQKLVQRLREAGAKEVHLLVSCPPIISPCFMGVDFPTYDELAAPGRTIEQLRQMIGLDSLNYTTLEGLVQSISIDKKELCMACVNGDYPTKIRPDLNSPTRCD